MGLDSRRSRGQEAATGESPGVGWPPWVLKAIRLMAGLGRGKERQ